MGGNVGGAPGSAWLKREWGRCRGPEHPRKEFLRKVSLGGSHSAKGGQKCLQLKGGDGDGWGGEGAGREQTQRPHGLGRQARTPRLYAGGGLRSRAGWDTGSRGWLAGASGQRTWIQERFAKVPGTQSVPEEDSGEVWKVLGDDVREKGG